MGIMFVSVKDGEGGDNPYRTGRMCVVKEEAVRKLIVPSMLLEDVLRKRFAFIPDSTWEMIGLPTEEVK